MVLSHIMFNFCMNVLRDECSQRDSAQKKRLNFFKKIQDIYEIEPKEQHWQNIKATIRDQSTRAS